MSDTKILSGEQVRNVFRMGSDISMVQVCESHYAQAQKIGELSRVIDSMLRCVGKNAANVDDPVAAIKNIYQSLVSARDQRDAALDLAEAAEAQVKALLEAMPAKRAEEIADAFLGTRMIRFAEMPGELRAYAAAAKPKER